MGGATNNYHSLKKAKEKSITNNKVDTQNDRILITWGINKCKLRVKKNFKSNKIPYIQIHT